MQFRGQCRRTGGLGEPWGGSDIHLWGAGRGEGSRKCFQGCGIGSGKRVPGENMSVGSGRGAACKRGAREAPRKDEGGAKEGKAKQSQGVYLNKKMNEGRKT